MATHHVVIDLTGDDDEDEEQFTQSLAFRAPARPATLQHQSSQSLTDQSSRSFVAPSAMLSLKQEPDPSTNPSTATSANHLSERPAKRQRTGSTGRNISQGQPFDSETTGAYLTNKLWPEIDGAIERLAPACEINRRHKLHFTVHNNIVNKDEGLSFQKEWLRSGGALSPEFEASITRAIERLVTDLKDRPERLLSPPAYRSNNSTVLPSIEADADTANGIIIEHEEDFEVVDRIGIQYLAPPFDPEPPGNHQLKSPLRVRGQPLGRPPRRRPLLQSPTKAPVVTPQRLRARVKATQWQSGKILDPGKPGDGQGKGSAWFGLPSRPYLSAGKREVLGQNRLVHLEDSDLHQAFTLHVDFGEAEIRYIQYVTRALSGSRAPVSRTALNDVRHLLKKAEKLGRRHEILDAHENGYKAFKAPPRTLLTRSVADLESFLSDVYSRNVRPAPAQVLTLSRDDLDIQNDVTRTNRIPTLLYTRETVGNRAFGSIRRYENFTTAFKASREDALEPRVEWTNCAGDIATISWVSDTQFVCGTTTHSDSHNQQYNKPGNLLLGSSRGTLRAFPDHRILRPVVAYGDNALNSMVESQDPWLYSSVVSSDYDPHHNLAFTSSFDKTVKIWKIEGESMEAVGTWEHEGRVNFVIASKHRSGLVATAADVLQGAVRVYQLGDDHGSFDSYSCTKIHDEEYVPSEKWGYYPAAIRWGLAPNVQHLLLIGYSPRALSGDDHDIPEDKINTGELCIWDTLKKTQVKVNSVATQNVFEVVWHPSRNCFAAATSKAMTLERADSDVKTQVRIFEPNEDGHYGAIKTLDCAAADINELIIQPNSAAYSYIAACCTDGKVYVWDTAGTDAVMCVLEHGEPMEELIGEREQEDVGVKFVAWGTTADRLYTGSSDGVLKVWNIRHGKGVHLRDLVEAAGPITCGAISPDYTKLVVGDGSGRVYLLSLDGDEEDEDKGGKKHAVNGPGFVKLQLGGLQTAIRRPRPVILHPEVPAPDVQRPETQLRLGQTRARGFLERQELVRNPKASIGAVKGPNYHNTGLFRAEAHRDDDATQPLLGAFERQQQENNKHYGRRRIPRLRAVEETAASRELHRQNSLLDLDIESLPISTRLELEAEGADLNITDLESNHTPNYEEEE